MKTAPLANCPALRVLILNHTNLTDADVPVLCGLLQLRYLDVRGTRLSEGGCLELQAALPGCNIHH